MVRNLLHKLADPSAWSYDAGLLLLRLGCALMLLHGWSKLTNFTEGSTDWPDPLHVGSKASYALTVFAEVVCTVCVVLGLFTRFALVPLIVQMLVLVFIIYGEEPFADRELALLYLMPYLTLLFTGPGNYAMDRLFQKGTGMGSRENGSGATYPGPSGHRPD